MRGYQPDLAYIHDVGFGDFSRKAGPGLLAILRRAGIHRGRIVDLGCGSGIWAAELTRWGYDVVGVDISRAMIRLARKRAPAAKFVNASFLRAQLPRCDAVTAIGECLNYTFDGRNSRRELARFFRRVSEALRPGGVFIFDIAEPGRALRRAHAQGKDWAILFEAVPGRDLLIRRMTTFRKVGKLYRRSQEIHRLRLYRGSDVAGELRAAGFTVRVLHAYGHMPLPPGCTAFVATKRRAT
ncbi:MAG TPA: class I SAM-dependent methyltransferase [Terriglobales bacterium]|jgi:SAM-dependent methyltransferase|nr:class I SAM-dependent methyltransferase [Terriglobales bacterium]